MPGPACWDWDMILITSLIYFPGAAPLGNLNLAASPAQPKRQRGRRMQGNPKSLRRHGRAPASSVGEDLAKLLSRKVTEKFLQKDIQRQSTVTFLITYSWPAVTFEGSLSSLPLYSRGSPERLGNSPRIQESSGDTPLVIEIQGRTGGAQKCPHPAFSVLVTSGANVLECLPTFVTSANSRK